MKVSSVVCCILGYFVNININKVYGTSCNWYAYGWAADECAKIVYLPAYTGSDTITYSQKLTCESTSTMQLNIYTNDDCSGTAFSTSEFNVTTDIFALSGSTTLGDCSSSSTSCDSTTLTITYYGSTGCDDDDEEYYTSFQVLTDTGCIDFTYNSVDFSLDLLYSSSESVINMTGYNDTGCASDKSFFTQTVAESGCTDDDGESVKQEFSGINSIFNNNNNNFYLLLLLNLIVFTKMFL